MNSPNKSRFQLSPEKRSLLEQLLAEEGIGASGNQETPRRAFLSPPPLSYAQQRLWFLDRLVPGNPFYNIDAVIPLRAQISAEILRCTLNLIVQRHETLRTTFVEWNGQPVQWIAPRLDLALPVIDLRHLPPAERESEARRLAAEKSRLPFDLSTGPLIRAALVWLDDANHLLLLTLHHIISDGWSLIVFLREMEEAYLALATGRTPDLPELSIQYADFAVWQRQWLSGARLEQQLDYWKKQLEGISMLQLPTDKRRPPLPTFQGAFQPVSIPKALTHRLRELSHQEGCTLFMTLLTAFKILLCRYTGQEDIAIGSPIANRNRVELEPLIGFFVNTLVLRTDLSGNPTVREALQRVRETALGAYAHQDLPFERLVEELQPDRDLSRNPLFQVIFQLFNAPGMMLEKSSDAATPLIEIQRGSSKFDLRFDLWETADGLRGQLEYSTDLFEASTISRMAVHFHILLQGIAADPDAQIWDLPLLTRTEQRQIIVDWNATSTPYPGNVAVHRLFEERAAQTPDAIAVEFDDVILSYSELNDRANRLAGQLRSAGVGPETPVGVLMERSADMIVAFLGTLKAGGAYVPLDTSYPPHRLAFMLEDVNTPVVLTQAKVRGCLPETRARVICVDDESENLAAKSLTVESSDRGDNLAYIMYTSGSTGQPKGVCVTHRAISRLVLDTNYIGIRPSDVIAQASNASFDAATFEVWGALLCGAKLVGISREIALSPTRFAATLRDKQVTILFLTTVLFNKMAAEVPDAFRALRFLLFGGEASDARWVRAVLNTGPPENLLHVYGPTETTTFATFNSVVQAPEGEGQIPIGRPISNTTAYVLDRNLRPVPIGAVGELFIGGDGVARGYWQRPALTEQKFLPSPFADSAGNRLYRTGDLARCRPDGDIEFYGRTDQQVKVRGFRVELAEIESTLAQHPAVRQSAVTTQPGTLGDVRLAAYVVADPCYFEAQADTSRQESRRTFVEQWQQVFDKIIYEGINQAQDYAHEPTFNIAGWTSSYTGLPIPVEEMKEQVQRTVERIAATRPRRVLEIGCGTGLLLFPLAPRVSGYVGTDFSTVALDFVQQQLNRLGTEYAHVTLLRRLAEDFSSFEPGSFDTVVLNSVVQYLPSIQELARILELALTVLEPGGKIFLGDLRSYGLLEALHTSIELFRAPNSLAIGELQERIQKQIAQEQELTLTPAFFSRFKELHPEITGVQIQPKRGRYQNELARFRYDVLLQLGPAKEVTPHFDWRNWMVEGLTVEQVRALLSERQPQTLALRGIPNARLQDEAEAVDLLREEAQIETVAELRAAIEARRAPGVHPEDFWSLGDSLPYDVYIRWSAGAPHRFFDALLVRRTTEPGPWQLQHFPSDAPAYSNLSRHANNPLQGRFIRSLVPDLHQYLETRLPDYMVPSSFVLMDALPISPNGKVDRSALPKPDSARPQLERAYVVPSNAIEQKLAAIWAGVLGLEMVGVHDNFFTELGGHSLLATQVVSRVREVFRIELPLRYIFETPTVADLAAKVAELITVSSEAEPLEPITPGRPKPDVALDNLSDDEVDSLLRDLLTQEETQA